MVTGVLWASFVCLLVFWILGFCYFFRKMLKQQNVQIVVARYNENVDWLNKKPFNKYPIFIYDKGPKTDSCVSLPKCKRKFLPNVGRCDHTYLYYIIENYDSLPDFIVFLPGSAYRHPEKYEKALFFMKTLETSKAAVERLYRFDPNTDYRSFFQNFQMEHYRGTDAENREINNEYILEKSKIRPFGKWFEHYFSKKQKIHGAWFSGVLIATRERIRQNPISFYKALLVQLENHSNPEVGHYIERTWFTIFTRNMNPS